MNSARLPVSAPQRPGLCKLLGAGFDVWCSHAVNESKQ